MLYHYVTFLIHFLVLKFFCLKKMRNLPNNTESTYPKTVTVNNPTGYDRQNAGHKSLELKSFSPEIGSRNSRSSMALNVFVNFAAL